MSGCGRLQSPRRGSHGTRLGGEFIVGKWLAVDGDAFREIGADAAKCRIRRGDPPAIAAEAMKAPVDPFPLDPAM